MIGSLITSIIEVIKTFFMLVGIFVVLKVVYESIFHYNDGTFYDDIHRQSTPPDEKVVEKTYTSEDKEDEGTHCGDSHQLSNLPTGNVVKKRRESKSKRKRNRKKEAKCNNSDFLDANLNENFSNSQLSKKQDEEKVEKTSLSKTQHEEKLDKAFSDHIQNKKNDKSFIDSQLQYKQHNEKELDKGLPTEDFLDSNLIENCSNSQLSKQQDEEKVEKTSSSKDIENKLKKYSFNFHIGFKQQNEIMKSRKVGSKIKENPEEVMSSLFDESGKAFHTADVAFFTKEDKACVPAHILVLAAKSQYFRNVLFGGYPKESKILGINLEISNVSFCTFLDIIKWFYSEKIEFSDDYTVLEIYKAAKLFEIQQLLDECKDYIESMKITDHNVLSNLHLPNTMKIDDLDRRCTKYIEQNTLPVINSAEFLEIPFYIVKKICDLQSLSLTSEVEMLEALVKWLDAQQPKLKKSDVKSLEKALLRCVRFLNFSPQEFVDVFTKHPDLFTPDERLSIFSYLFDPNQQNFKSLPAWCSKSCRTLASNPKSVRTHLLPTHSETKKIEIQLKDPDVVQDINELTSLLEMRCMNDIHEVKSVTFSFQAIKNKECVLEFLQVKIKVLPIGKCLYFRELKNLPLINKELTFHLLRGIAVYKGQVLRIEVTANLRQGNFLQFGKWIRKSDFVCLFGSKPKTGMLYFISEVEYGPLTP